LRAVALLGVLGFHNGFDWISGGYLPLTTFFVLSGFLITSLLLIEHDRSGRIDLARFWGRRARRLVPASLAAVVLVGVFVAVTGDGPIGSLRGDLLAALTWTANWRFILSGQEYGDLFGDPSPFQHFWSLAVEEQFYLCMPLATIALLWVARGRRWMMSLVVVTAVAGSTLWMRVLHQPGEPPLRSYFGTDTRAAEILVGALLAVLLTRNGRLVRFAGARRSVLNAVGAVALGASVLTWLVLDEFDSRLYEGGLAGIALVAAMVVAAGTQEGTIVARTLAWSPLVRLGRISYGVYLFHWPVFLMIDDEGADIGEWPLFALRMGITIALAVVSWRLLERPIRAGRWPSRIGAVGWANASVATAGVAVALIATVTPPPTVTLDAATPPLPSTTLPEGPTTTVLATPGGGEGTSTTSTSEPPAVAALSDTSPVGPPPPSPATTVPTTTPPPPPLRIMVVGDSMSRNLATGLVAWSQQRDDIVVHDASERGCPLADYGEFRRGRDRTVYAFPQNCIDVIASYPSVVGQFDPDVVVAQDGLGQLVDARVDGSDEFSAVGDPAHDNWLFGELTDRAQALTSSGARLLWTLAPCADAERHYAGLPAETLVERLGAYNQVVRRLTSTGYDVQIQNLYQRLCPNSTFTTEVEGQSNGRPDGVHLSDAAATHLAEHWLGPAILQSAGRG